MTFSEERDPNRFPDSTAAAGEGSRGQAPSSSESQGRRSPPPLPEDSSAPSAGGAQDWLEDEERQNNGKASSARLSGRALQAEDARREQRASSAREAAAGSSRGEETESSRPRARRAGQALVPRRSISSNWGYDGSARSSAYAGSSRSATYGYTAGSGGSGGYGGGGRSSSSSGEVSSSDLTILLVVALLAFFGGFAIRNLFAESGGFDDERPIRAANVPAAFRDFCFAYNGTASFTVVQLTSVSALTMASVPIYKMDTCTIPVSQTANALQALGIRGRANTLGPQLGGSNLTLIQLPLASGLARAIYNQFPSLASQGNEAQVLSQLETTINDALRSNVEGLALQGLEPTNIPDVYVVIPGHSFNLQPQLNLR
ncbi:hypothetical protein NW845_00345 [Synechococcus sp. H60.2]|uniref:hypothetical protein n=1 Tax=Synechococcus sp. H60.2 TaxID=2964518 RepID=UPI0039C47752